MLRTLHTLDSGFSQWFSNLPYNSSHHVCSFWVSLHPNDRALTEHLANNDLVNVFNVLIKAETAARLEDTPYFRDDNLRIEVLAEEHRGHDHIERSVCKIQICRRCDFVEIRLLEGDIL